MKEAVAELKAAAQGGNVAAARAAIARAPAAARDWRPILEAALYGEVEIVRLLLAAGADPNAQSVAESRYRPLHRAKFRCGTSGCRSILICATAWLIAHEMSCRGTIELARSPLPMRPCSAGARRSSWARCCKAAPSAKLLRPTIKA